MQIIPCFVDDTVRKMPKRQQGRGSGGGSGGSGRDSDNNPQGNSRGQSRSFPEQSDETNNLGNPQNDLANPGNNNLSGNYASFLRFLNTYCLYVPI